ncbi:adenosylmethionine--8-amino-7-oxononanoate transaminase [Vallitalea pronyensis]|uniref:Adenosylmethionine-8-amino-7-oxononanoate aminotransferase n=1 Tax=Vallitalea pronyensis TaxID=1348613 RepID=A0A8J8SHS6_9FIRM|nr:adenosylmethionine--8-amino-7-oxononanoate transaminase [Vallitalea pronyensis]QUI24175.1 adenosylmethionine--8-amino-7-oxononanoate transaminase [Vallitalea pronyensis]
MNKEALIQMDLDNIWHPCSQMKDYETFDPIIIKKGKGVYLEDIDGNRYIDAVSSWWVNLFGHCHKRIGDVLAQQANTLEHTIFVNFTHEPAIALSERILKVAPQGLEKIFFGDNGSSAVEIALKLSFQYHQQAGRTQKKKFMALTDAYHGETLAALAVSGCELYNAVYKPILMDVERVQGPDCYRCQWGLQRETCKGECIAHVEEIMASHHEEITAIIIEPLIQCAAGMKMYSPIYLKKLRGLCHQYDIHMIADEIAVGFGRTGEMFACDHAGITPDFMCVSKGLTAGYMPLSLVLMTNKIYEGFYDDYTTLKAFLHSHSYSGNPLGCAIAVETLKIFEEEQVIEKNRETAAYMKEKAIKMLQHIPQVGDIRFMGMVGAIELVKDRNTKEPFDWKQRVGYEIYRIAVSKGVLLRPLGNIIYFMPPYVIAKFEIDYMIQVAKESIELYFRRNKP